MADAETNVKHHESFKVPHTPIKESLNECESDRMLEDVNCVSENLNPECKESERENNPSAKKVSSKTPKSRTDVPLPYSEPAWSGIPPSSFSFEIIKNGAFVETYDIKTSVVVFGRLDVCNIVFEHPSVSRYHAVVQYCAGDSTHPQGFYLYDLGSTHGTFLNKEKITSKVYYKLKVGYMFKLGGSTRLHIFQGPEEEVVDNKPKSPKTEEEMCTWGMVEDAEEDEDLTENPFALSTPNEELYLDDPKKTLRGWFEREGYELEYDVEEKGFKTFLCRIQLPVDNPTGDFIPIEATVSGKKKEAVVACALEACRTLDRLGLLRQSQQESRQRKKKKWEENDYYDSDEDTFLDRTGTIEKKREMRKKIEKKTEPETFESLQSKLKTVTDEINEITNKLSSSKSGIQSEKDSDDDTLEAYMSSLSDAKDMASDKMERRKLKYRLLETEKEKTHLEKLLEIVRPTKLPPAIKHPGMIGKKIKSKLKLIPEPKEILPIPKLSENEEEIEEESDSEDVNVNEVIGTSNSSCSLPDTVRIKENNENKNIKSYGLNLGERPNIKKDNAVRPSPEKQSLSESTTDLMSIKNTRESKNLKVSGEPTQDCSLPKRRKKNEQIEQNIDVYTLGNAEYSTWVPPTGQTGDGITHLNAKYGY